MTKPPRVLLGALVVQAVVTSGILAPQPAFASSVCGASNGHTLCVTGPDAPLTGEVPVTVTNTANKGIVIAMWLPSGGASIPLITRSMPSPESGDYSFVWPTEKYLDASGVLRLQAGSTSSDPVDVAVTLANGNLTDFQHSPSDWANYLPQPPWSLRRDPVIAGVGDGPSDEPTSNSLAQSIVGSGPDLFLFLGDIYENGTFTEDLNVYGLDSMDGSPGALWGQMGTITQPTIGNHEAVSNVVDWQDYFHGRPLYTSFVFGNVLFFDLASSRASMKAKSAQYKYVAGILTNPTTPPPPCIVAFWHIPALLKASVRSNQRALWALLTDSGGDVVLNGHVHTMIEYQPLNDQLQLPSAGQSTMVELVDGAGGHKVGGAFTNDARVEWSVGHTPGSIYLTLNGAANGGVPTSLSWSYEDGNGNVLYSSTRSC